MEFTRTTFRARSLCRISATISATLRIPPRRCQPTKLLGERVGRQYAATRGLEVVAVRIGWVWKGTNEPGELPAECGAWFRDMWLSDRDFLHLMECCLTAPLPEPFLVVNGMSANTGMRWDLTTARTVLGYHPRDNVHAST